VGSILLIAAGCKKNNGSPAYPLNIYGKWYLLKDSSWYGSAVPPGATVYNGQAGDYINFNPGGQYYINESGLKDTLSYSIINDTTMSMAGFLPGGIVTYTKPHNPYKLIMLTSSSVDPEGQYFYRKVWLAR